MENSEMEDMKKNDLTAAAESRISSSAPNTTVITANSVLKKCGDGIVTGARYAKDNAGMKTAAVATGVAAVAAAPLVISAAGFGAGGVVAGSLAAGAQSTMGGTIAAGSTFAMLQSAGAVGLSIPTKILVGATGAAAVPVLAKSYEATKDIGHKAANGAVSAVKSVGSATMKVAQTTKDAGYNGTIYVANAILVPVVPATMKVFQVTKDAGYWTVDQTFNAGKAAVPVVLQIKDKTWNTGSWILGGAVGIPDFFTAKFVSSGDTSNPSNVQAPTKDSTFADPDEESNGGPTEWKWWKSKL